MTLHAAGFDSTPVARRLVRSYRTFSPLPDLVASEESAEPSAVFFFSLSRARDRGRVGVTHRRVLSCSDFPPVRRERSLALVHRRPLTGASGQTLEPTESFRHAPAPRRYPPLDMPASVTDARSTLIRCAPSHLARTAAIARKASLAPAAIACPGPKDEIAAVFPNAEVFSDPRHALATAPVRVALWLDGPNLLDDPDTIELAHTRSITILTTEPWPASLDGARAAADIPADHHPIFLPQLRASAVFADIVDTVADLGPVRSLALAARSTPADGSLAARLVDAMLVVHTLLGVPETIDCAHVPADPLIPPGATPQALRSLQGDLGASLRFSGRRAATVSLSNIAGPWFRGLTVLCERGSIRACEQGLQRFAPDGSLLDATPTKDPEPDPGVHALVTAITRALDHRIPPPPPPDLPAVVAMCHAALLSARTSQAEPPATLLRMASGA